VKNFKFEVIIQTKDINNIDYLEIEAIKQYKSNIKDYGYNLQGGGNKNKIVSETTKIKQSIINRNNKIIEENLEKLTKANIDKNIKFRKLSNEQVIELRKDYEQTDIKITELAIKYGTSASTISGILLCKIYKNIQNDIAPLSKRKLKLEEIISKIDDIKQQYANKMPLTKISEKYNISINYINQILDGILTKNLKDFTKSKLNLDEKYVIQNEYSNGNFSMRELAAKYNVSITRIRLIIRSNELDNELKQKPIQSKRALTYEQATEIKFKYEIKMISQVNLATEYNVAPSTIYAIVSGKSYKKS